MLPEAWGAYHIQDEIRRESSSGGVFSALAETVLAQGGIVFGAAMFHTEEGLACRHIACESAEALRRLRGSKYTVSELGNVFVAVQKELRNGKRVLFSGTPCQTAALYVFLGNKDPNLITVDLICHGVPIPYVLRKCIREKENRDKKEIVDIAFRDKTEGWNNYSIKTMAEDGFSDRQLHTESRYMGLFLSDQYLRPSCYACQFKGIAHRSDITLGDFWGVQNYLDLSREEIEKGISMVVLQTEAGKQIFSETADRLVVIPSTMDYFQRSNIPYTRSAQKPVDNWLFRWMLTRCSTDRILKLNTALKPLRQIGNKIVRKIGQLRSIKDDTAAVQRTLPGKENCYGCRNCENVCPSDAIEMRADEMGVLYPAVREEKCIRCGKCLQVCPRNNCGKSM